MAFDGTDSGDLSEIYAFFRTQLINTLDGEQFYFKLSSQANRALDIVPKLRLDGLPEHSSSAGSISSRADTTVLAILNKCRTVSGTRLLSTWLRHPLKSKAKIDLRLDIVSHLAENAELRTMCYDDYLKKIPDLMRISFKISKGKSTINELVKVSLACLSIKKLCQRHKRMLEAGLAQQPDAIKELFEWVCQTCDELVEFNKLIHGSIEFDKQDEFGNYAIKPECDDDIAKLSTEIGSLCDRARRELHSVADDIGLEAEKTVKLETDVDRGFQFKVTKIHESAVRDRSEYQQSQTVKKDGYRFTNKQLRKLSDKYIDSRREYDSLSKRIIDRIVDEMSRFDSEVLDFSMAVSMVDVFVAMAVAGTQNNYVKPLILDSDGGKISILGMRHPCVECQPDVENYVSNDITFNRLEKNFFIVTGPNMGGKSTFIKSVAVNVLMAQCGSLVPAEDARISIVDGIYTRVGAGDRQMEGVSTFMEEMSDMAAILRQATTDSLVVIDELGRGTSTFDGFGLAWAISHHLATQIKAYTLFATHYHELTELEEEVPPVGNLHVKAVCQDDKLTMLFNVGQGVCDESYGINVAQYTNFPPHVIDVAKNKLRQFEEVPGFGTKEEVGALVKECVAIQLSKASL